VVERRERKKVHKIKLPRHVCKFRAGYARLKMGGLVKLGESRVLLQSRGLMATQGWQKEMKIWKGFGIRVHRIPDMVKAEIKDTEVEKHLYSALGLVARGSLREKWAIWMVGLICLELNAPCKMKSWTGSRRSQSWFAFKKGSGISWLFGL